MRKLVLSLLVSIPGVASIHVLAGCSRTHDEPAATQAASIAAVSVDELDHMLANHDCVAVDANGEPTRQRMGVIPGAVLLRDADSPDAIAQLPADKSKQLVFYCANEACRASHNAATKAFLAGYAHVKVLPAGIAGWVRAGKTTSSI
jgi:rhodanese-related sulfurtransferase